MASNSVNFTININGQAATTINGITKSMSQLQATADGTIKTLKSVTESLLKFNMLSSAVQNVAQAFSSMVSPGIVLDKNMHDLSAITNIVGDDLKRIEEYARGSAKTFGGTASDSVESYKLLLSQLTPEIAQVPEALKAMGDSVSVLSKTMNGDVVAATEVLTTAMNQYNVSLDDPIKASESMAKMMNVMAAAANEGSAELPQIKEALQNSGMAASAAKVSFEELNAAIQVLDKAGKKGAEGGVAIRNVLATLSQGRFLPKDMQEELKAAGVNVDVLTDKSLSMTDRLRSLKSVMNDTALITKLFGKGNNNAALAVLNNLEEIDRITVAVTGTNVAFEQAQIVMQSYEERQKRVKAKFDDLKISIFQATGDLSLWMTTAMEALTPLAGMSPMLALLGSAFKSTGKAAINFSAKIKAAGGVGKLFNRVLHTTSVQLQLLKQGFLRVTKSIYKYIADLAKALVSTVFSTTAISSAWATMTGVIQVCCKAIGSAIKKIPIIGWIAAIISLVIVTIQKFEEWGAALDLVLGGGIPIIGIFMSIYRNWQNIVQGFKDGGIAGAFKQIAKAVVEAWTYAINQIFEILSSKFPTLAKFFAKIYAAWQVVKYWAGVVWKLIEVHCYVAGKIITFIWNGVKAVWNFCKGFYLWIWSGIKAIFNAIVGAFKWCLNVVKSIFNWLVGLFESFWNWIVGIFEKIGINLREKLQPVLDFFGDLWNTVVAVFDKIMAYAGKLFNPIIKLWNAIRGDSVEIYQAGLATGTAKYGTNNSTDKGKEKSLVETLKETLAGIMGGDDSSLAGFVNAGLGGSATESKIGQAASGGNSLSINFRNMIENQYFEGGVTENKQAMSYSLKEILNQVVLTGIATARQ